jgi:hypothetical protein
MGSHRGWRKPEVWERFADIQGPPFGSGAKPAAAYSQSAALRIDKHCIFMQDACNFMQQVG